MNEALAGAYSFDLAYGDGTDTYNGVTGFMKTTDTEDVHTLGAGKTAFADLAYNDPYTIAAKPFARSSARGRWYMSRDVVGILAGIDCSGKAPLITFEQGQRMLLNRPIRYSEDFPLIAASAKNTAFMGFGDLQSYLLGIKGVPDIGSFDQTLAEYNQTLLRLVTYFDIQRKFKRGMVLVKTANA
jgi:HK97 family phage major capsid protein